MTCQASAPRDVFPPTPPGPEGSNGNGLLRVQWVAGAWLNVPRATANLKRFSRTITSGCPRLRRNPLPSICTNSFHLKWRCGCTIRPSRHSWS